MQQGSLARVVQDNIIFLRIDVGHLLLMDACQQNLDIDSLHDVSHDSLLAFDLRFTVKTLSDSYSLNEVLTSLGRPTVTTLAEAFMVRFSSTLPKQKTVYVDESSNLMQLVKKTQITQSRKFTSLIEETPPVVQFV